MSESSTRSGREFDAELASFIANLSFTNIPEPAVRSAERAFVDIVGVTLAGAAEGAGETAIEAIGALIDDCGDETVLGTNQNANAMDAAFLNATAGHGLDFDDVTWGVWHPSVPMVAPILAAAEDIGADGRRAITGYVAGFETQVYLAQALLPAHYEQGWHATATFGTFGAAAAVATILDLDTEQTRQALNIAASMPAGLKHNFGSMTKPMHAGQAARSGLTAAYLAAEGFTASDDAIGAVRGFIDLYSGDIDPNFETIPTLGERWGLIEDGIQVKKFPCCYFTHPGIAAALALREQHNLTAEEIVSVEVTASQGAADALHYTDPDTGLEGKFSMQYPIAVALTTGQVGLAAFDDENIHDPEVQAVRKRVTFEVDPDLPYDPYKTTVHIETTNGESHERVQDKPPGTPHNPLSDTELREKFEMCVAKAAAEIDTETTYTELNSLREQETLTTILDRL